MNRNIKEDLHGIDYVCYFKNGYKHINVIDMSDESTVENTGDSWCEAAYGNALVFLELQKITDTLYLMEKDSMNEFRPFAMSREEQIRYLEQNAKRIITREEG